MEAELSGPLVARGVPAREQFGAPLRGQQRQLADSALGRGGECFEHCPHLPEQPPDASRVEAFEVVADGEPQLVVLRRDERERVVVLLLET